MISVAEMIALITLDAKEERALEKLESTIDSIIFRCDGAQFNTQLRETISPKLAAALQRKYEAGGWRVAYRLEKDAAAFTFIPSYTVPHSPATGEHRAAAQAPPKALPPVIMTQVTVPALAGKRLLVRMPTRGRPIQAIDVLAKYRAMAGIPVTIEVVLDEDDATMLAPEVLQRLYGLGCVITVGGHKSKVDAVNGGRVREWDVLLLASDDMVPAVDGYAKRALDAIEKHFPHLDGAVYFDDGYQGEKCCTLPIMGRRLYDQFGYVYHPDYKSLFCDQEQTEVLSMMGRLKYVDEKIIEHKHWVVGATKDALYERNDALWEIDRKTFEDRRAAEFYMPRTMLSVLVCSLPSRRPQLDRLLDHLWAQILSRQGCCDQDATSPREVEILVDDRESITIGEKRRALTKRARGNFIAFVDDDDWVSHDYIERILKALRSNPAADCASLNGVMTTAGAAPEPFYGSLKYAEWSDEDGVHYRTPTHLNPVLRELALAAGFEPKSFGEDLGYSRRLHPLLKREASTGDAPLYYYFYQPGK